MYTVALSNIDRLWVRFCDLDKDKKGYLTKFDLIQIPELQTNPVGARIIDAFLLDKKTNHSKSE